METRTKIILALSLAANLYFVLSRVGMNRSIQALGSFSNSRAYAIAAARLSLPRESRREAEVVMGYGELNSAGDTPVIRAGQWPSQSDGVRLYQRHEVQCVVFDSVRDWNGWCDGSTEQGQYSQGTR